jgi:polysaccharide biosynthesis protein PslH
MSLRILYLSTWFPHPPDNGSKLRVYHLLGALARHHAVTLVSFASGTARPEQAGDLCLQCNDVQAIPLDPFVVNRAGALRTFLSARPVASRPVQAMSQRVAEVLESKAFDLLIASTEMMAAYALHAPAGTAKILEEHNSMGRWMRERYAQQTNPLQRARCWASWQKQRHHERRLFPHFRLVTMVSEADRAVAQATAGNEKVWVEVVPNGVDCEHNRPGLACRRPRALVYNGALTYSANYDAMRYFLDAIHPLIRQQDADVSLTVTGSFTGVRLDGLHLDDSVRLSGHVPDVRIPVSEASVCVIPIRQGGGTRIKILEAMALGTPVVATSKGAEGLDVTPEHDILLADEPAAFAAQVLRLLSDGGLRERLSTNARRLVEGKYDWRNIGRRFVDLVEEVAARRGATDRAG